ncbi:SatD family protein [Aquiflexum sp. TKW24L]|uniref:winged helix-turn-helix transcriptional regulator n=1 Tax=Aquiflexum sp. TKW24L TaxID=2942212 RepID=UPI0020BF825F|nr:winged helix-turn-helix transcriptional regulator [Aquiflexum sp. TKW24L]MCL6259972.1 SatD family protein [Aquiflexum sp. TKW24L]
MLAVITGDIVDSRKLLSQQDWLLPLESLLNSWGSKNDTWEIFRGDSFQLEISNPLDALYKAMLIKATLKSIKSKDSQKRTAPIDVRMSIGIGEKEQDSNSIGTRTGSAYINSGEAFEQLRNKGQNLMVNTPWEDFDKEMNVMLKLALIVMDNWSGNSGEIMKIALENPHLKQTEIGEILGIEQNSVSARLQRAYHSEMLELNDLYREKLIKLL